MVDAVNSDWNQTDATDSVLNKVTYGQDTSFPSTWPVDRLFWRTDENILYKNEGSVGVPDFVAVATATITRKFTTAETFSAISGLSEEVIKVIHVITSDLTGGQIKIEVDSVEVKSIGTGVEDTSLIVAPSSDLDIIAAGAPYDISGASYSTRSHSVSAQEANASGVAFNNDGTKMYILGFGNNTVYQYTLTTGFDVSTASYASKSFSVAGQETLAREVMFNDDGTKMYTCGNVSKKAFQYTLSTAFDVSTASYASKSLDFSSQDSIPLGMAFNDDGTKLYMVGVTNDKVYQYTLTTAYDLSTGSFASKEFSVASQEANAGGVTFNDDGTKMYIVGASNNTVYQYTLSTAYDVSTASYDSISFSVASQETDTQGIVFNDDGTKMYIVGTVNDTVYEYDVETFTGTARIIIV